MGKKVLFMGTPDYATKIFEEILNSSYEIVGLFTQPDKPIGRKQVITAPHIKQFCIDNNLNIPIYQPEKLRNNQDAKRQIEALNPDFIIVAAYGQILPKDILDIAPCINLHASLLPKYRGASPIQESLLNGDTYTGVTSMLMAEGLDSGDILGLKYFKIPKTMEVAELFSKLSQLASKLTIETLDNFERISPKVQNEINVSYCKKIKKEHGEVSFENAEALYKKYKAYSYWPGVYLKSGLKLKKISLVEKKSLNNAGEILAIEDDGIIIACQKGSLKIAVLQAPSKKEVKSIEYIRGQRISIGSLLT
ncbi:methionyl-tRNA formyltransferase [Arcobacter sp. F2176]|uniref:methionyl-tRNA formyltransferase n=1 Tax=Arcobacter sp. F2176 TaxID=2044511 RepID=UPI00100AC4DC|nr:methionyl-tRNA formyltransferase [Arcobacter sp. F2176]RXJ79769.1 methionyl-tRNA formyltransferase [Arcobacter sp. F2176]